MNTTGPSKTPGAEPSGSDAELPTTDAGSEGPPPEAVSSPLAGEPEAEGEAPEAEGEAPEAEGEAPEDEGAAPEVERAAPEVERAAPEVERAAPEAEGAVPEVERAVPEVEGEGVLIEAAPSPPATSRPASSGGSLGRTLLTLVVGAVLGAGAYAGLRPEAPAAPGGAVQEKAILYWRSTMIPGEMKKEPGKDSMGMDMVPVYEGEEKGASDGSVLVDSVTLQSMGVRLTKVTRGPLVRKVRAVGYVDYNEPLVAYVSPKVSGWIEKIHVDTTGGMVHKGDPLFEVYSPDLFAAQAEYLLALGRVERAGNGRDRLPAKKMLEQSRTRLRFFEVPDDQIALIEKAGKAAKTLTIRAPIDGVVTHKEAFLGGHFKAGERIYTIADLSTVWVFAEVYEHDLPYMKVGQEATMRLSYLPGRSFAGRVTYVYPYLDAKTRTARVRMEFHNPGFLLKPGMFAVVKLKSKVSDDAVLAPESAILRSGERATVFVWKGKGRFLPTEVKLGLRAAGDKLQIRSGLEGGEEIALSGQFLIDSESQLQEAIQKMLEPEPMSGTDMPGMKTGMKTGMDMPGMDMPGMDMPGMKTGMDMPGMKMSASKTGAPEEGANSRTGKARYRCPMPIHKGVFYDEAGACPLCGMTLIPADSTQETPTEPLPSLYWVCPMPEHAEHLAKPGRCPLCGMTLISVAKRSFEAAPESGKR